MECANGAHPEGVNCDTCSTRKEDGPADAGRNEMDRKIFIRDPPPSSLNRKVPAMDAAEGAVPGPLRLESAQASIVLATLATGARFAIGDDLPTLGMELERLALVTNPDLLQMGKLGRAAKPLDLMTYRPEDGQP